jgi:hypothetical protein
MRPGKSWWGSALALCGASLLSVSAAIAIPTLGTNEPGARLEEVSVVPEPAAVMLFGAGIVGAWCARRRARGASNDPAR